MQFVKLNAKNVVLGPTS